MNNDAYAAALAEIEEGRLDKGAWARAFAESGGDESKAKALYIKARAESTNSSSAWPDTQPPIEDVPHKRVAPGNGKDTPDNQPVDFYETAIGEKNLDFYIGKFHAFDEKGPGLHASWNWAAFFFTGFWSLYRKMYVWFFAWWAVGTVLTVFSKVQNSEINQILGIVVAILWIAFTLYANALYHRKIEARIATARKTTSDAVLVKRRLSAGSGVNAWAAYVFGALPVIGIVAAVALPAYQDDSKRRAVAARPVQAPSVDSMGWTQETTNSTEIGPWLDYAPTGTRYYRDAKGTIYQLYPPGTKPNAEPANPYSFSSSTLTAAELLAQGQAPAPKVAEFVPFNGKLDDYQDAVSAIEAKDYTRAANILQFLAAEGNSDAQWRLAVMYQNGQGVPQDYKEAVKWNRLAAAQGNAFVHYNLAQMYESGQGTPQNFVQAHKWFNLAATSNVPSSAQRRDTLEQSMSPQQIALAQQMARDCQQQNFKGCD